MNAADRKLVEFIRAHRAEHGFSPSYDECAAHLEVVKSVVFRRVKNLVREGVLGVVARGERSLYVIGDASGEAALPTLTDGQFADLCARVSAERHRRTVACALARRI